MANTVMDMLPEERPKNGDLKVVSTSEMEVIIEWHYDSVSVNLYVWPHSEFENIVPDMTDECELCSGSSQASRVSELPVRFKKQFHFAVTAVEEEYGLVRDGDEGVCVMCMPGRGGTLSFTEFLR